MYNIICETNRLSRFNAGYRMLRAGMIQRDDMGWEVGGGFRIGNSCTPMADSWQNQYSIVKQNKVKFFKKINGL